MIPASTCLLAILVLSVLISAWNNPGIREYKINELIIISVIIDYICIAQFPNHYYLYLLFIMILLMIV